MVAQLVKKFPTTHRTQKVHYCTCKNPPLIPVVGQTESVHIHQSTSSFESNSVIFFFPFTPVSGKLSLPLKF